MFVNIKQKMFFFSLISELHEADFGENGCGGVDDTGSGTGTPSGTVTPSTSGIDPLVSQVTIPDPTFQIFYLNYEGITTNFVYIKL